MDTPVLFLIFNRPDTTFRVFEEIRKQKPASLFIAADGPRAGIKDDPLNCRQARGVADQIDWNCDVSTLFRDNNLGCGPAVSEAISWFFSNNSEGIILEDDCLPEPSFFRYCEELLKYYRNNKKVMMISGNNFQNGIRRGNESYYFSRYSHIWGWASWRRAWEHYDYDIKTFPEFLETGRLKKIFTDKKQFRTMKKIMSRAHRKYYNTWDFQWNYALWENDGLCAIPENNLVTNIGFDVRGTHTNNINTKNANLPVKPLAFPLRHPVNVMVDQNADDYAFLRVFYIPVYIKLIIVMKRIFSILK